MIDTTPQQLEAPVRDPVCGMTIDAVRVFATRTLGEETFSFCLENCVQQFDREHTGSATTGVSGTARLLSMELPVTDGDRHHGIVRLQEHLSTMPGVAQVIANAKSSLVSTNSPARWACSEASLLSNNGQRNVPGNAVLLSPLACARSNI